MNHADHVALISEGAAGAGPAWLELGGGDGAFTLALADVLGDRARITGIDRDGAALVRASRLLAARFPRAAFEARAGDFEDGLPEGPFDGVLAANSLHFVKDRGPVLTAVAAVLAPGGRLVVVEYDADRGNPWVPHPFSFRAWQSIADEAGFREIRLLHRVPSRFLGAIYGAVATRP